MKKIKLIIICLCISFFAVAQTQHQQVYVKTKGRLHNGQVIPGKPLAGVVIKIKGHPNTFVSSHDGKISFPIIDDNSSTIVIQSVKKNGYLLVDPDMIAKRFVRSSEPIILIMESTNQIMDDKLAAERKVRRTLQKKLQEKEDEIESLKAQNKLNEEEYRKALQQIYSDMESNESIISEMAEHYSTIDYDLISELDLSIADNIINGNLTKADSLLRQKGNISDRIAELYREIDSNEDARTTLEASTKLFEETRMDLAKDCYRFHERFLIEQKYDSAAYYLELRAALDTTNIKWNLDAGKFIIKHT